MLYDFKTPRNERNSKTLCQFLDDENYAQVSGTGFRFIRRDFGQEEDLSNISYRDDGIYLTVDGVEYKGYVYLKKKVQVEIWGPPAYHIKKCKKLQDEINVGGVDDRYYWHNSNVVDIISVPDGSIHKDLVLKICGFCSHSSDTKNTQEFYDELVKNNKIKQDQNIEPDIFGYAKDWQNISQNYKIKKNYTCEKCNIQMVGFDKRYIHTDHKNGNKTMNVESNFECLCILCHCYKDEHHRENFGKRRMKRELQSYVEKFRQDLLNLGNKYLKQYDRDNK